MYLALCSLTAPLKTKRFAGGLNIKKPPEEAAFEECSFNFEKIKKFVL